MYNPVVFLCLMNAILQRKKLIDSNHSQPIVSYYNPRIVNLPMAFHSVHDFG